MVVSNTNTTHAPLATHESRHGTSATCHYDPSGYVCRLAEGGVVPLELTAPPFCVVFPSTVRVRKKHMVAFFIGCFPRSCLSFLFFSGALVLQLIAPTPDDRNITRFQNRSFSIEPPGALGNECRANQIYVYIYMYR